MVTHVEWPVSLSSRPRASLRSCTVQRQHLLWLAAEHGYEKLISDPCTHMRSRQPATATCPARDMCSYIPLMQPWWLIWLQALPAFSSYCRPTDHACTAQWSCSSYIWVQLCEYDTGIRRAMESSAGIASSEAPGVNKVKSCGYPLLNDYSRGTSPWCSWCGRRSVEGSVSPDFVSWICQDMLNKKASRTFYTVSCASCALWMSTATFMFLFVTVVRSRFSRSSS